jgi:nucleotide-binding universal stress UspA family protein
VSAQQQVRPESERVRTGHPIVVAVDGSDHNRAAVDWAAAEAAATGCAITLVTAVDEYPLPVPHFTVRRGEDHAHALLARVRERVRETVSSQEVRTEAALGSAVNVLLAHAKQARMLVVGKRGLGAFARVLVGSTSIALAGRSPVPVVVVPDSWAPAVHVGRPVVVGIEPGRSDAASIRLAFRRARRFGVPLIAVHGWHAPSFAIGEAMAEAGTPREWEIEAHEAADRVVAEWRDRFRDVDVQTVHSPQHPAMAVLDAAEGAQMVVLGRHTDTRLGGFGFGSVTRAVLHYSDCPVTVVPSDPS